MLRKRFKNFIYFGLVLGLSLRIGLPSSASDVYELVLQPEGEMLVSPIVLERTDFNVVMLKLENEVEGLMADFGRGMEEVETHDDGFGAGRLIFTEPTKQMQFFLPLDSGLDSLKIEVEPYFEVLDEGPYLNELSASNGPLLAQTYPMISRSDWGADENMRVWNPDWETGSSSGPTYNPCSAIEEEYSHQFSLASKTEYTNAGQPLTWPIAVAKKVEKFVVHHTDSDVRDLNGDSRTDSRDYRAMVRAIYKYHTLSRGWGDIGYNYIIDPLGNIYEGRSGGDGAIGAHSLCFNHGTMGIAIIGNYENNELPEPAFQALVQLIGEKAKKFNINPQGESDFRGKRLGNVFAHRNVRATSCPGDALYAQFDRIRDRAALSSRSFSEPTTSVAELDYNAELIGFIERQDLDPGHRKKLTLKFENTGTKTWDETTWMHVALNNDPDARVVPAVEGKSFVAADLNEDSVRPGKTGTFTVELEAGFKPGSYGFSVSPVINQRFKISRASTYIPFSVNDADYAYEVISH